MRLTFLGKDTVNGGSPTLFATDGGGYVVQGWKVRGDDRSVEIPHRLLAFLEPGTRLDATVRDTGLGTYVVSGAPLTDPEALVQMNVPGHEAAVFVGKVREEAARGSAQG
jgi:hypothetical protein